MCNKGFKIFVLKERGNSGFCVTESLLGEQRFLQITKSLSRWNNLINKNRNDAMKFIDVQFRVAPSGFEPDTFIDKRGFGFKSRATFGFNYVLDSLIDQFFYLNSALFIY